MVSPSSPRDTSDSCKQVGRRESKNYHYLPYIASKIVRINLSVEFWSPFSNMYFPTRIKQKITFFVVVGSSSSPLIFLCSTKWQPPFPFSKSLFPLCGTGFLPVLANRVGMEGGTSSNFANSNFASHHRPSANTVKMSASLSFLLVLFVSVGQVVARQHLNKGILGFFLVPYSTLLHLPPLRFHCVRDARIEPRTVARLATLALAVRRSNYSTRFHPQIPGGS